MKPRPSLQLPPLVWAETGQLTCDVTMTAQSESRISPCSLNRALTSEDAIWWPVLVQDSCALSRVLMYPIMHLKWSFCSFIVTPGRPARTLQEPQSVLEPRPKRSPQSSHQGRPSSANPGLKVCVCVCLTQQGKPVVQSEGRRPELGSLEL